LEVSLGEARLAEGGRSATARVGVAPVERAVEPIIDYDYSQRVGYVENFLGIAVPMPRVFDLSLVSRMNGSHVIPYHHFSIVLHKDRRLALITASNVDARPSRKRPEPRPDQDYSRDGLGGLRQSDTEKWRIDPRIPASHQLPDRFYTRDGGAFDKGHLVRREDVAWGKSYDEVRFANGDTFHVMNCSPQVADFNRSDKGGLWGELENAVLNQARAEACSIFAGPVLDRGDPQFRGAGDDSLILVQIPQRY
jgi:endonuclease G